MMDRRTFLAAAPLAGLDSGDFPKAMGASALTEVRALHARADRLLQGLGLTKGEVGARIAQLFADERYLYPDSDDGRDKAVADLNASLAWIRPRLGRAFGDLAIRPAEVRRMNGADEASRRAGYRVAGDANQIGVYYVDLSEIRRRPRWTLPSVAFHEVTPGHLLQIPLQAVGVKEPDPFFEGWATYAEQLAFDLGAYAHDPRGEIGYIHWRLFRIARVVADTGLQLGWSRDQALAVLRQTTGPPIYFLTQEADVDRMIASPGKAAREGQAAMTLAAQRPRSVSQWPAYHRRVLTGPAWSG
jgi:uncharacterized protein (DUF885 family)